ncbi:MAG: methyltransferase domain-containing protein [Flavisolibacter sp.]
MGTILFSGTIPEYYEKYLGPILFEPYALELVQEIDFAPKDIIELACGTGQLTRQILRSKNLIQSICATDVNEEMLRIAEKNIPSPIIFWKIADVHQLPYEKNLFDLAICQFGIMFFSDKPRACTEVQRVLKPRGSFIFNTWDRMEANPGSRIIHESMQKFFKGGAPDFIAAIPFSYYETGPIKNLLIHSGFTDITIRKIKKTAFIPQVDDLVNGFLKGTPLAVFLAGRKKTEREEIYQIIKTELVKEYGLADLEIPMQALSCCAKKIESS